jgi:molybdopterin/thiamine biosynthesis adenylyltransferase
MQQHIRIKTYFQMLQRKEVVDFIKTLDEGVKLPAGDFFDGFLETIQNVSGEDEILAQLSARFKLPPAASRQFLDKVFELGIIEYYHPAMPTSLNRYHRQLLLFDSINPQTNFEDNFARQEKLQKTHVLILGIGGIGNFMAMSLVAAGVGKITLVDHDVVEESNLNRQVLFTEKSIGNRKAAVAAARLQEMNTSCEVNIEETNITSQENLAQLIQKIGRVDYLVLSADKPVDIVLWASALCRQYQFKYIKCGYMAYQGLIGPLLGPNTKRYEELFQSWASEINTQNDAIQHQNDLHTAPSMAATNAILANIAALEMIKDITEIIPSVLLEKRLLFNLKTMEMYYD